MHQNHATKGFVLKKILSGHFGIPLQSYKLRKYLLKVHKGGNSTERPVFCNDAKNINSGQDLADFYHAKNTLKAELPSCNMQANARACAYVASVMSTGGYPIMSETTWKEIHSAPEANVMFEISGNLGKKQFEFRANCGF